MRVLDRNAISACIIFFVVHFALLAGVTTPDKFYFDEVHYVPAARQMLEPTPSAPSLNPMHPPLAKYLIALSIQGFGDTPLGWRYPGVLFGSLAIVAHPGRKAVAPAPMCEQKIGQMRS